MSLQHLKFEYGQGVRTRNLHEKKWLQLIRITKSVPFDTEIIFLKSIIIQYEYSLIMTWSNFRACQIINLFDAMEWKKRQVNCRTRKNVTKMFTIEGCGDSVDRRRFLHEFTQQQKMRTKYCDYF